MKKYFCYIILFTLLYSCKKDDSVKPEINFGEFIEFNMDGFDLPSNHNLQVFSYTQTIELDSESGFHDINENNEIENYPVFFVKNEEIIFGYYPKDLINNQINTVDILLYYLKTQPEILLEDFGNLDFKKELNSFSKINKLEKEIISSVNQLKSPFENSSFISLFNESVLFILERNKVNKNSSLKKSSNFKIDYNRNGKISWNQVSPLYSGLGVIIVNEKEEIVSDNILEPNSFETKLFESTFNLFFEKNKNNLSSYTLNESGEYKIKISNGSEKTKYNGRIFKFNRIQFLSACLSIINPLGFSTIKESKADCLNEFRENANDILVELSAGKNITRKNLKAFLIQLSSKMIKTLDNCNIDTPKVKYLKLFLKSTLKRIGLIGDFIDGFNLLSFIRDFSLSSIKEEEIRYFSRGSSIGKLHKEIISDREFSLPKNTDFEFRAKIKEDFNSYKIKHGVRGSEFIKETSQVEAEGVLFDVFVTHGDTSIKTSPAITNTSGQLFLDFTAGTEDSNIEIKPSSDIEVLSDIYIDVFIIEHNELNLPYNSSINFRNVCLNKGKTKKITIGNYNNHVVPISISQNEFFKTSSTNMVLQPASHTEIEVTFTPKEAREYYFVMNITDEVSKKNTSFELKGSGEELDITDGFWAFDIYNQDLMSCSPINETGRVNGSIIFKFNDDGSISVRSFSGGEIQYFDSSEGSWSLVDGLLSFRLQYKTRQNKICSKDGKTYSYDQIYISEDTFKAKRLSNTCSSFFGDYTWNKKINNVGDHSNCDLQDEYFINNCKGEVSIYRINR